jgi:hypothetical protein
MEEDDAERSEQYIKVEQTSDILFSSITKIYFYSFRKGSITKASFTDKSKNGL